MERLHATKYGIILALLTLVYGFGLGGVFGAAEEDIKGHLRAEGQQVLATAYGEDAGAMQKVANKAWVYFKRAHLHANGLGTASLALILLLGHLPVADGRKRLVSLGLGLGSLGYSLFWMWAGLRAPGMGSTGAAKESLQWLAVPSSGLCILGVAAVLIMAATHLLSRNPGDAASAAD